MHQQLLAEQLSGRQRSLRIAIVLLAGRVLLLVAARELAADSGTRRGRAAAGTAAAVALRDIRDLKSHRIYITFNFRVNKSSLNLAKNMQQKF